MTATSVRNNIRRLRFEHGELTQAELARKVGVTRQTIVAIEKEKYSPSLEAAFRIARVFNVALEDVFSYQPKKEPEKDTQNKRPERAQKGHSK